MEANEIVKMIDNTALYSDKTEAEISLVCQKMISNGCYSVHFNACHISLAKVLLQGEDVKICTVVGFPLGNAEFGENFLALVDL